MHKLQQYFYISVQQLHTIHLRKLVQLQIRMVVRMSILLQLPLLIYIPAVQYNFLLHSLIHLPFHMLMGLALVSDKVLLLLAVLPFQHM